MNTARTRERPILFSGPMVRAILDDGKTQTRRVIKPQPAEGVTELSFHGTRPPSGQTEYHYDWMEVGQGYDTQFWRCPYGQPGDRLWVREKARCRAVGVDWFDLLYAADEEIRTFTGEQVYTPYNLIGWSPSIHMPRWASRITLEVVDVRGERVQDISGEDCIAEGCTSWPAKFLGLDTPFQEDGQLSGPQGRSPEQRREFVTVNLRTEFRHLWDTINAKRGYGFDANSWVWVIEFKRLAN